MGIFEVKTPYLMLCRGNVQKQRTANALTIMLIVHFKRFSCRHARAQHSVTFSYVRLFFNYRCTFPVLRRVA